MNKVTKGELACDPRGLIYEAFRMDDLTEADCRTIFLDWSLGLPEGMDIKDSLEALLLAYASTDPQHPMGTVLREGLEKIGPPKRRGGRAARVS